ncbi:hypothetical protein [Actinokineospora sp. NBRC 105648]|uniref:hypothetical protein n=1 Tax=Actinokineospora sp. NBRC 105648 TaxID=3032206 RepID=UPI0025564843|nr:hypothetical protein [Actinokineospora sp. NBRC 105648]
MVAVGVVLACAFYTATTASADQSVAPGTFGCALPGGERVDVPVEFGLVVPSSAVAGTRVTVEPTARLVLPAATVRALRASGPSVDTAVKSKLVLRQGKAANDLPVEDLVASETALPVDGDLTVTAIGKVATFSPAEGEARVDLSGLTASLRVGGLTVECAANPGTGVLGAVNVSAAAPTPQVPVLKAAPVTALAELPPGLPYNFDLTVKTRIAKLKSDVVIGPGSFRSVIGFTPGPDGKLPLTGDLDLPPAKAYLVVFRFMPVDNTITLTPDGQATGSAVLTVDGTPNSNADIDVDLRVNLRISDVRQDGVPLNVGDKCRTVTPLRINLKGKVLVVPGSRSVLKTTIAIPAFTGCGTTENLDRLITGLVSGPGNELENELVTRAPV